MFCITSASCSMVTATIGQANLTSSVWHLKTPKLRPRVFSDLFYTDPGISGAALEFSMYVFFSFPQIDLIYIMAFLSPGLAGFLHRCVYNVLTVHASATVCLSPLPQRYSSLVELIISCLLCDCHLQALFLLSLPGNHSKHHRLISCVVLLLKSLQWVSFIFRLALN